MHTKTIKAQPVALFLFAHQDDEYGVFYEVERAIESGLDPMCFYLTDGSYGKAHPNVRNRESLRILSKLRVQQENICFVGTELHIKDTQLCYSLSLAISAVSDRLKDRSIVSVYCPAWEGGHPDHDALNLLTSKLIMKKGIRAHFWQYPLYNSANLIYPFFRVLKPFDTNGTVVTRRIPINNRLKYLHYCISYRSQIKSWIGLFPMVVWHYLTDGHQYLQEMKATTDYTRPHAGMLYYEKRAFMSWSEFERAVKSHLE